MTTILDLAESTNDDVELIPEILPVDARLSVRGPVSSFQSLFERAASVTPVKEIISGTGHALLEAFTGSALEAAHVKVTATDGDLTVSMISDDVTVQMPGAALVPAKKILDILKLAPTAAASIEVLGNSATLRSGRAQWSVATPVGDTLPPAADVSAIKTYVLGVAPLLDALRAARKSAATGTGRATLSQLLVKDGSLLGMDSGRMHRQTVANLPAKADLTIPLRVTDELIRMLQTATSEKVEMGGNSSHLVFRVDSDVLIAQRALVPYPDINTYLLGPALTNLHTLTVDRLELAEAIKRVRVNADPEYSTLFLAVAPGKSTSDGASWTLTVSARDRSGNSAREAMPVGWSGPSAARTLTVNHKNLSELLATAVGEDIVFRIGDDTKTEKRCLFVENKVTGFSGWVQQVRSGF